MIQYSGPFAISQQQWSLDARFRVAFAGMTVDRLAQISGNTL
jgi:hypothetical protein